MASPYSNRPDSSFWKRAVAGVALEHFDPVLDVPFTLLPSDKIATAGSCFAQHIARTLVSEGFSYLVTEPGASEHNYGVFPARFGNIYSTLQLLQLFQRAYGLYQPQDHIWRLGDGYIDPFRPLVETYCSEEALLEDRAVHLSAVRKMFEECDVFIFTLGLTETWMAVADEAVVPLAPGVSNTSSGCEYKFSNRTVPDMIGDMEQFVAALSVVNPNARIILTVSPVPLIATFEPRHVLVSTVYSKSALRVVAEHIKNSADNVTYFPSYEIINGNHIGNKYFENDLREVRPEGVKHVMSLFKKYYLSSNEKETRSRPDTEEKVHLGTVENSVIFREMIEAQKIICDEENIDAQN
jgi:hypothetical protein